MNATTGLSRPPARVIRDSPTIQRIRDGVWTVPVQHDNWSGFTFGLVIDHGRLVSFEVYGGGETITARMVRTVPFRDLEAAARLFISGEDGVYRSPKVQKMLDKLRPTSDDGPRRRKWDELAIAHLCAEYVALRGEGTENPVPVLAERHFLSEKYVRNLIAGVRGDLITHGPPGRAGGELTDKAKGLLDGDR